LHLSNTQGNHSTTGTFGPGHATRTGSLGVERTAARDAFRFALVVWLISRMALTILGATIMAAAPDWTRDHVRRDYPDVSLPNHDLYGYSIGVWNIYDVPVYTDIAEHGYGGDLWWQTAYFPGYPLLIKLFSFPLLGEYLLSALLVANLFALLFFWCLYRLVDMDYGAEVARRAVIWAAIFPTSFILFMGYTESIMLAAMVGAVYFARRGTWWLAGLLSGLAALTKQPGIFILLPLAYILWQEVRANRHDRPYRRLLQGTWLLLCPLTALSYTLYRYLFISVPIQDLTDVGGTQRLAFPGYPLLQAVSVIKPDNPMLPYNLMDIFFAMLTIALVAGVIIRVRSWPYVLFAVTVGLANLSVYVDGYINRPEVNSPRRLLLIFPIFILLALVTHNRKLFKPLAYISAALYIVLAGLFTNWVFVS
jgi:4-amino-4-deoxy-L-arabinose transferase-like glycosyltransferase